MNRLFFCLIALLVLNSVVLKAQERDCSCSSFLSLKYYEQKKVFKDEHSLRSTSTIAHDTLNEDYIHFLMIAQKDSLFRVVPWGTNKHYDTCWVINTHIAVFGTNYSEPLHLYERADSTSDIVATVQNGFEPEYVVIGCSGSWLLVEFNMNNKKIVGWLAKYDQCASAYTTCN